ncbi:retrovirus-related pol polyprotein from transposon TNT 1-94 [Tanacetum coccineum]
MTLTAYADADNAGCQDTRRSTSGSAQFLGDKLVSWSSNHNLQTMVLHSIRSPCILITAVPSLSAAIMSSTPGPSTLTYATISLESKLRRAWLNYKMADENVPALAPTRSDDQILPFAAWVPIGKRNYVLDLQKKQKNPIFQISVDILQNTNFFRAFTASASVPAIYIQQFWNTLVYKAKTRDYSFQLDETQFVLDANLLREALEITPIDQAHKFVSPPSGDAIMDFVNELGSASPFHLAEEDPRLGNLKFVPKGEEDEVFRMPIPNELISNNIRNAPYYNAYLEMVAKHDRKIAAEKAEKKKPVTAKQPKPKPAKEKSSKPAPAPKPKVTKEKPSNPSPTKQPKRGKVQKLCKGKPSLQLIDEDEPTQPELEHQGEGEEYDVESEATRPLPVVEGKGKAIATNEQAAQSLLALHTPKRRSITDQFIFQRRTSTTEEASTGPFAQPQDDASTNIVRESLSTCNAEIMLIQTRTNSGGDMRYTQQNAGSDPGKTPKSRPPPDDDKMDEDQAGPDPGESCVALARPNPEPTYDEFMANVYPNVHESLKFPVDEHVILEDPLSSIGTLSSMKNLDDAFTIGDQFINDKSTEDEPEQLNVEAEVVSMVTVLIYQASSSVLPLSTPVIDLSSPFKPVSSTTQAPIFRATTTNTTTTLPPSHPQQQSSTDSELAALVITLEKKFSDLEQKNKNLDNTTRNLGSRVFTLELRDLPNKIDEAVRESVKEAVHVAL